MSVLAYVRDQNVGTLDYEGQIFGYAYELMEQVSGQVGKPNPMTYAVDEDELIDDDELDDIIEQCEAKGEDSEEAEDQAYTKLGEYFDKAEVLSCLEAYQAHFEANPELSAGKALARELALDLRDMIAAIEGASDRVRIYLG